MNIAEILKRTKLPTLSRSIHEIIKLESEESDTVFHDLKQIIEKDPALCAHILQVANSPYYALMQKVRTIRHAIQLLGIQKIRQIAFSYSIFGFLQSTSFQPQFARIFNLFLKKSLLISMISALLAKEQNSPLPEELQVAGLLADIGQLVLFLYKPASYAKIYSTADADLLPAESKAFQTTHIEVGQQVCDSWQLPALICECIAHHNDPASDTPAQQILFLANGIAEWLLLENEQHKEAQWQVLESQSQKLLRAPIHKVKSTIFQLPETIDSYLNEFPEVQKDLKKLVEASSVLIISLMEKEMALATVTRKAIDGQLRLSEEKSFLTHILNLSHFFSSLLPPQKIISALFHYFEKFIPQMSLGIILRDAKQNRYSYQDMLRWRDKVTLVIDEFPSLKKAASVADAVTLEEKEAAFFHLPSGWHSLTFPIAYHHNLIGFLLWHMDAKTAPSDDEIFYIRILANIIANSIQNYASWENLRKETLKREYVTRELIKSHQELTTSADSLQETQKNEIFFEVLPVIFHKLKNKLTPILGYAQILSSKTQDAQVLERLQKIEKNSTELADQLNRLRNYFKTSKKPKLDANINDILQRMNPYFQQIRLKHGVQLELEMDDAIPEIAIDQAQIETLIAQLVDNALVAVQTRKDTAKFIWIRTRADAEHIDLIIKDNGIGIANEEKERIWTPFYSSSPEHIGIGLTICEKVISNHDGTCNIYSEPGQYTEIEISLPIAPAKKETPPSFMPDMTKKPASAALTVLIVDDEEYSRDLMKEILEKQDESLRVFSAGTSTDAVNLLQSREFALVIGDIRMPESNEEDWLAVLQAAEHRPRLLIVTTDPEDEDIAEFLRMNHIPCLKKPFAVREFISTVQEILH